MSVEYCPAFRTYSSNYILYQNVSEIVSGENGVKKGRFWAKMTGWVVSRSLKCGISFAKCCISFRKCGISQNREIVDTPTFQLFGLYMWYLKKKLFFQKTNFTVFRWYIVSFVSVCIRVVCTYITYIMVIFFLIILPRWIYNAVFFWRQYEKRIFFKKFWSDVHNVLSVWYSPINTPTPVTPRPHVLNVMNVR